MQMLDQTGYPLGLNDRVEITLPNHHRSPTRSLQDAHGTVVGLDLIDWRTGEPRGDHIIYVRVDGDEALVHIHPARVRVLSKHK